MRPFLGTVLALALALPASGPAFAQQNLITDTTTATLTQTSGTVREFDAGTRMLTLDDGARYEIAPSVQLETLQIDPGDAVQVYWHSEADKRVAAQLVLERDPTAGSTGSSPAAPAPDGGSEGPAAR